MCTGHATQQEIEESVNVQDASLVQNIVLKSKNISDEYEFHPFKAWLFGLIQFDAYLKRISIDEEYVYDIEEFCKRKGLEISKGKVYNLPSVEVYFKDKLRVHKLSFENFSLAKVNFTSIKTDLENQGWKRIEIKQ